MRTVCIGEITIDRYLDLGRDLVGGISLNAAVNARRLGVERVGLVSSVGTDSAGTRALDKLAREGVEATHVRRLPGLTARQDIRLLTGVERLFPPGGYHSGVLADFDLTGDDLDYIRTFDLAIVPVFRQLEHIAGAVLDDTGFVGRRVADFLDGTDLGPAMQGLANYLPRLDLAFISADASALDILTPLSTTFATPIVVTLGAAGSVALVGGRRFFQPALAVDNPIDTTGAGDAFGAACALSFFQDADIQRALRYGAEHAATVITHYGATDA